MFYYITQKTDVLILKHRPNGSIAIITLHKIDVLLHDIKRIFYYITQHG